MLVNISNWWAHLKNCKKARVVVAERERAENCKTDVECFARTRS